MTSYKIHTLEHWNRQKILSGIWQYFPSLLDEGQMLSVDSQYYIPKIFSDLSGLFMCISKRMKLHFFAISSSSIHKFVICEKNLWKELIDSEFRIDYWYVMNITYKIFTNLKLFSLLMAKQIICSYSSYSTKVHWYFAKKNFAGTLWSPQGQKNYHNKKNSNS